MTENELNDIAKQIRESGEPRQIVASDVTSAFNYGKRNNNVEYLFNDFLEINNLVADQPLQGGWPHKNINLSLKHHITNDNFRLLSLRISHYKNLSNVNIDFTQAERYCAFIGVNGSGKSNIIEAISLIFYHLHQGNKCSFEYTLSYAYKGQCVIIRDGLLMPNGKKVIAEILPKNIIASYSGEDTRLWDNSFKVIFEKFCSRMTSESANFEPPFMFYINRRQWDIALLTLLYSEDADVVEFVKNITKDKHVRIEFVFNNSNKHKWDGTHTGAFVDVLSESWTYDVGKFRETINKINFIDQSSTLFYHLYRATINEAGKTNLISEINIKFGFNDGDARSLSEGEKKLILSNLIIYILASKGSLCLFDEPDSHIHINNKSSLLKLVDTNDRYSIVTTHSPTLVNQMNNNNVRYIANGKIQDSDKINQIRELSGGAMTLFDGAFILSSKKVIVTEGTYDIKYIKRAIELFSQVDAKYEVLKKVAYIPMGSASNTNSFFEDVIKGLVPNTEKILYVFDYDGEGLKGYNKVSEIKKAHPKLNNLFYQNDYSVNLPIDKVDLNSTCYVEDLFSTAIYSHILTDIRACSCFREFKGLNVNTASRIKKHIEEKYLSFNYNDFIGFQPLLDKLVDELV